MKEQQLDDDSINVMICNFKIDRVATNSKGELVMTLKAPIITAAAAGNMVKLMRIQMGGQALVTIEPSQTELEFEDE